MIKNTVKTDRSDRVIGLRLYYYRTQHNLTQQEVADAMGLYREGYINAEHGIRRITLREAVYLSALYQVTLDELILKPIELTLRLPLGETLASLRLEKGLSQAQLAELTGTSQSLIAKQELGQRQISASALRKYADALHVSTDDFFRERTEII